MKSRILVVVFAFLLTLAGCVTTAAGDWPDRFRAEVSAMTKAYSSAAIGLSAGAMSKEAAAKVLEETDRLHAQLTLAGMFRPSVEGSEALIADQEKARAMLVTVLAVKK